MNARDRSQSRIVALFLNIYKSYPGTLSLASGIISSVLLLLLLLSIITGHGVEALYFLLLFFCLAIAVGCLSMREFMVRHHLP